MPDPTRISALWTVAENARREPGGLYAVPIEGLANNERPTLAAVDELGHRYLLVPLEGEFSQSATRQSGAIRFLMRDLNHGTATGRFAALGCTRPWLNDIFASVAAECLDALEERPSQPVAAIADVLRRWQELFEEERRRGIPRETLQGLIGELVLLNELTKLAGADAIRSWQGPVGARHDFTNGRNAVEVKTSRSSHGRILTINGVDQLLGHADGELHLACIRVEVLPDHGLNLWGLIGQVVEAGTMTSALWDKLSRLGITPEDRPILEAFHFEVHENRIYQVNEAFPRIIRHSFAGGDIPPGVASLSYEIDLTGEHPAPVSEAARVLALRGVLI